MSILSCLLELLGSLFFGFSPLGFLGPLALLAMLPALMFGNLATRIVFWSLAALFLTWQMSSWRYWSEGFFGDPETLIMYGSMWSFFLLMIWRGIRRDRTATP
ncbi:MAG TPA: hypothetical protein VM146_07275 [Steroidobacteraceae bacterium]|nr:hypothetical protein [Steroidobacteraceae bacterium]